MKSIFFFNDLYKIQIKKKCQTRKKTKVFLYGYCYGSKKYLI